MVRFQRDLRLKVMICFLQIFACKNMITMYKKQKH